MLQTTVEEQSYVAVEEITDEQLPEIADQFDMPVEQLRELRDFIRSAMGFSEDAG